MLMSLEPTLARLTAVPRVFVPPDGRVRTGSVLVISNPQNQVYWPRTFRVGTFPDPTPSNVTRSPGYWRTMMGLPGSPLRTLLQWPVYVPPRSQIVSPGWTEEGCENAFVRFHGLPVDPLPERVPLGVT
jgi:hypothetical protein